MASKKNKKTANKEENEAPKFSKQDQAITHYMYEKVPSRVGDLHGMEVKCFYAEDAVNVLLDSPWASNQDAMFTDRKSCVDFCHELLCKEMFHKAEVAKRKHKPIKTASGSETDEKKSKKKKAKSSGEEESAKEDSKAQSEEDNSKSEETKKKVKKLKLLMSHHQYFEDGREVYVWIYEPQSWKNIIIGSLILIGLVAACCYPLWPPIVRTGVYYLSLAGAGFLGVIIFLAIFRYIVYYLIYGLTLGKHRLFLFPNLTEDCGFFESFVPVYEYSTGEEAEKSKSKKSKNKSSKEEEEDKSQSPDDKADGDKTSDDSDDSNEVKASQS